MTDQPTPENDDQIPEPTPATEPTEPAPEAELTGDSADSAPEPTEATGDSADSAPEPEIPRANASPR